MHYDNVIIIIIMKSLARSIRQFHLYLKEPNEKLKQTKVYAQLPDLTEI